MQHEAWGTGTGRPAFHSFWWPSAVRGKFSTVVHRGPPKWEQLWHTHGPPPLPWLLR